MTRYIDTWRGKIAVDSMTGVDPSDMYIVNLVSVRDILQDPDYMAGCYEQWFVHDEDEFIELLKERFSEDSTNQGFPQRPLFPY